MEKLFYKVYQCDIEKLPKRYKKWYSKIAYMGTVDTDGLAKHIMEHGTIYTDDVVLGLTRKLMHCIGELLRSGYKVKLDDIGTLYISCHSTGADTYEDFDPSKNITALRVKFRGAQDKGTIYSGPAIRRQVSLANITTFIGKDAAAGNSSSGGNDTPNPGAVEEEP